MKTVITNYDDSYDISTFDEKEFGTFQTISISDMGETITISAPFLIGTGKYAHNEKVIINIMPSGKVKCPECGNENIIPNINMIRKNLKKLFKTNKTIWYCFDCGKNHDLTITAMPNFEHGVI